MTRGSPVGSDYSSDGEYFSQDSSEPPEWSLDTNLDDLHLEEPQYVSYSEI